MSGWEVEKSGHENLEKEAQAKSDLHQVPSSPTQICVSAEIDVPSKDHETLIIELQPAAASLIPCIMLAAVQRHFALPASVVAFSPTSAGPKSLAHKSCPMSAGHSAV